MAGQWIEIAASDGGSFRAYMATPAAGKGPGLVLCQEIFGINEYIRDVADYYAEEGYVVVAPDLFWRIEPGIELGYSEADWNRAFELFQKFDTDKGMDDITSTVRALRTRSEVVGHVGAIGFCLGGRLAYLAAARSGVDCAVSYYGVTIDEYLDEATRISVPMVLHFASEDKYAPPEKVEKIQAALGADPLHALADFATQVFVAAAWNYPCIEVKLGLAADAVGVVARAQAAEIQRRYLYVETGILVPLGEFGTKRDQLAHNRMHGVERVAEEVDQRVDAPSSGSYPRQAPEDREQHPLAQEERQ